MTNYLMLVCGVDAPLPADADLDSAMPIDDWVELCGSSRIYGDALGDVRGARTVRVRGGETLVSDGPFTEAKEFVGGFDLLDCPDLDAAIGLAAAHPVSAHAMCELRPFPAEFSYDGVAEALEAVERGSASPFLFMFCADGVPEADAVEERIQAQAQAWCEAQRAAGRLAFGHPLAHKDTATTVSSRGGETRISDGPFLDTAEFLCGVAVLGCRDLEEAVALAAEHPLAAWHRVEVRAMMTPADWAAMEAGR